MLLLTVQLLQNDASILVISSKCADNGVNVCCFAVSPIKMIRTERNVLHLLDRRPMCAWIFQFLKYYVLFHIKRSYI